MADRPINPIVHLTREQCDTILESWLGKYEQCTAIHRMTGGCVHTVLEVTFGDSNDRVVFKVAHEPRHEGIEREFNVLRYYREHALFPLPEPLFCDISGSLLPYSFMIMERLPGEHMGDATAWMSVSDKRHIERAMGETVAELHTHTRDTFGDALHEGTDSTWVEIFRDQILGEYLDNEKLQLVSSDTLQTVRRVIDRLDTILGVPGRPTLVHGDIWVTNIMIAREEDEARLVGYLDPGGRYTHPEYELAYLEIWRTVSRDFFEVYTAYHPLLDGYEFRRSIYWLNTLLLHVRAFKTRNYARATEELVDKLRPLLR